MYRESAGIEPDRVLSVLRRGGRARLRMLHTRRTPVSLTFGQLGRADWCPGQLCWGGLIEERWTLSPVPLPSSGAYLERQDLEEVAVVVGPQTNPLVALCLAPSRLGDHVRVEKLIVRAEKHPVSTIRRQATVRTENIRRFHLEVLRHLLQDRLEVEIPAREMDRDHAVRLEMAPVISNASLVRRWTCTASLVNASRTKMSNSCGASRSIDSRASPRTTSTLASESAK